MNRKFLFVLWLLLSLNVFAQSSKKPHIVFVSGDHEYSSEETFPILAKELEAKYGFRTTVLKSSPDENAEENIPGLEKLAEADVAEIGPCLVHAAPPVDLPPCASYLWGRYERKVTSP